MNKIIKTDLLNLINASYKKIHVKRHETTVHNQSKYTRMLANEIPGKCHHDKKFHESKVTVAEKINTRKTKKLA
jgi:hypothetical protein